MPIQKVITPANRDIGFIKDPSKFENEWKDF